jgi:hypothetical protein
MSLVLNRPRRVIAGGLFFLAVGIFAPSQSAALEIQIERVSDQTAIVSVVPGQGGFNMSSDTPTLDGHPFPTGWRTTRFLLVDPFDASTNYDGDGSVSSFGDEIDTMEQNDYSLATALVTSWGSTGVSPPWCIPPSLNLGFSTPVLPISGTASGSVDVTLASGATWGSVGTTGTVCCGYYTTGSWTTSFIGPVVGTYTISTVPEPSALALLGAGGIGLLACAWRRQRRRRKAHLRGTGRQR